MARYHVCLRSMLKLICTKAHQIIMEKIQVYDLRFAEMHYLAEKKRLFFRWKPETAVMEDEEFQNNMYEFLAMFDVHEISSLCADLRTNGFIISVEMQDWAEQNITVASYHKGLHHATYVMPEDLLVQLSTQMALETAEEQGMQVKYVSTVEAAEEWLDEKMGTTSK